MRTRSTVVLALVGMALGCGGVSYDGEVAPPTAHLDVYFAEGAIGQAFSTMGTMVFNTGTNLSAMEEGLASAAMQRGADAVVIEGLSTSDAGSVATHHAEGNGRPRYIQDLATGGVRNVGGAEHHDRLTLPPTATVNVRLLRYNR